MRWGGLVCYAPSAAQLHAPSCKDADQRESRGRWRAHSELCASNPASCCSRVFRNLQCRLRGVSTATAAASVALQSSFRNIFLFILKMVSNICCCWPAMVLTASSQCARKVDKWMTSGDGQLKPEILRFDTRSARRQGKNA